MGGTHKKGLAYVRVKMTTVAPCAVATISSSGDMHTRRVLPLGRTISNKRKRKREKERERERKKEREKSEMRESRE